MVSQKGIGWVIMCHSTRVKYVRDIIAIIEPNWGDIHAMHMSQEIIGGI